MPYARRYRYGMKVFSVSAARRNLFQLVNGVIDDDDPLTINRGDGEAVVVISMQEWEQLRHLVTYKAAKRS